MNEMLPYIDYEIFEGDDTLTELIQRNGFYLFRRKLQCTMWSIWLNSCSVTDNLEKIKTVQSLVIKIGKRQGDETGQNKVLEGLEVVARNIKRFKPSMGQIGLDYIFELTSEARFTY